MEIGVLANLQPELRYLVKPAMRYGIYQDDIGRAQALKELSSKDLKRLEQVADRYRANHNHSLLVGEFFDRYPISEFAESARLYWLFAVLYDAGFALSPDRSETVDDHIAALQRFGSYRLSSERAFAARFLADFGAAARPAIPYLRQATNDQDLRVQVWAHYALAVLDGRIAQHADAIQRIYRARDEKDELGCHKDDVGAEAAEALEKIAEIRAATQRPLG